MPMASTWWRSTPTRCWGSRAGSRSRVSRTRPRWEARDRTLQSMGRAFTVSMGCHRATTTSMSSTSTTASFCRRGFRTVTTRRWGTPTSRTATRPPPGRLGDGSASCPHSPSSTTPVIRLLAVTASTPARRSTTPTRPAWSTWRPVLPPPTSTSPSISSKTASRRPTGRIRRHARSCQTMHSIPPWTGSPGSP